MRPLSILLPAVALSLAGASVGADDGASALLARTREAMSKLQSLRADVEVVQPSGTSAGTLLLSRPRLARLELTGTPPLTVFLNDEKITRYFPARNQYLQTTAGALPAIQLGIDELGFFQPVGTSRLTTAPPPALSLGAPQKVGDLECAVLEQVTKASTGTTEQLRYFISPADSLVRRVERTIETTRAKQVVSVTLKKLETNIEVAAASFQWTPPADAKPIQLPMLLVRSTNTTPQPRPDYAADLPAVGKTVPDFDLPRPGGGRVGLFQLAKNKKVTLVNFWFVGCPPCRAEFPHLQKLHEELQNKGFQIVAVNRGDAEERIQEFTRTQNLTFNFAMGGVGPNYMIGKAYGVRAYPTNILIDSDGKVLWRAVGFRDITPLREALKAAGIE